MFNLEGKVLEIVEAIGATPKQSQRPSGKKRRPYKARLLLVEDNPVNRRVAHGIPQKCACDITEAENRRSTLDILEMKSHDLVLTDLQMPVVERIIGVLNVTERVEGRPFEPQELEYINSTASIAGSALHGHESETQRDRARDGIMIALARLAEYRDTETGQHLERVTQYCVTLAHHSRTTDAFQNEIDDEFMRNVQQAAPLHDIGRVATPDDILRKPGRLTAEEISVMQTHTQVGAETIEAAIQRAPGSTFLGVTLQIAQAHHEWHDGSGYPSGINGDAIPLCAGIVAVADVYDALSTKRPYKEAFWGSRYARRP